MVSTEWFPFKYGLFVSADFHEVMSGYLTTKSLQVLPEKIVTVYDKMGSDYKTVTRWVNSKSNSRVGEGQ